jgi:hypothetical protein
MAREHWFDRLTAPHTRRTSLKALGAGLVGAAAATVPAVVKPAPAQAAESPIACRKGCLYVSDQIWAQGVINCGFEGGFQHSIADLVHGVVAPWLVPIANIMWQSKSQRCFNSFAGLSSEAAAPCLSNYCPGFDPYLGPYAPCQCAPGDYCYPCEASTNGYLCCIYKPGDCHGDCCTVGTCE